MSRKVKKLRCSMCKNILIGGDVMSATVKLKNIDVFIDWYLSLSVGEAEEICNRLDARIPERSGSYYMTPFYHALRAAFQVTSWSSYPPEATREAKWPAQRLRYYEETSLR